MTRLLAVFLAVVVATAGVIALLLFLQSRDAGSLDRSPPVSTQRAP